VHDVSRFPQLLAAQSRTTGPVQGAGSRVRWHQRYEVRPDGRRPQDAWPKRIDARTVWDRVKLDEAFAALDDGTEETINEWDRL
jgi:hypothetical protein